MCSLNDQTSPSTFCIRIGLMANDCIYKSIQFNGTPFPSSECLALSSYTKGCTLSDYQKFFLYNNSHKFYMVSCATKNFEVIICSAIASSQVPVGHLVFMVHGIGQRLEKANLVDDVVDFRRVTANLAERYLTSYQRSTQRVLFIPCQVRIQIFLLSGTSC